MQITLKHTRNIKSSESAFKLFPSGTFKIYFHDKNSFTLLALGI